MGTRRSTLIAYLTEVNSLCDANGMASTQLAAAITRVPAWRSRNCCRYAERSGLIEREVRGKRTYRINLGAAHAIGAGGAARASGIPGIPEVAMAVGVSGAAGIGGSGGVGGEVGSGIGQLASITTNWPAACWSRRRAAGRVTGGEPPGPFGPGSVRSDRWLRIGWLRIRWLRIGWLRIGWLRIGRPRIGWPCRRRSPVLSCRLATAWSSTASWPRRTSGCGSSCRPQSGHWRWPPSRSARLPASTDLDRSEVVLLQRLLVSGGTDGLVGPDGPDEARGSVGSVGSGRAAGSLAEASLLS